MDEFIYNSLSHYFSALCKLGHYKQGDVNKLIVLIYLNTLLSENFRGHVNGDDYATIERALNCLYGTSCLIPYPEFKKMGNLKLGDITEMAQRIKNIEDTPVIKEKENIATISDIVIGSNSSDSGNSGSGSSQYDAGEHHNAGSIIDESNTQLSGNP